MSITKNEDDTAKIAKTLAKTLKKGDILCLYGDLGAGKTVFSRALIRCLCENPTLEVPSPTFTLVQIYEHHTRKIWHFDLYRLEEPDEMYEIGWQDALYEGITIIEWPIRLGALLPKKRIDITIKVQNIHNRTIKIEYKT